MKKSKARICKYPKCTKEVHSSKAVFCMEHSRSLKETGEIARDTLGALALVVIPAVAKKIGRKK